MAVLVSFTIYGTDTPNFHFNGHLMDGLAFEGFYSAVALSCDTLEPQSDDFSALLFRDPRRRPDILHSVSNSATRCLSEAADT